MEVPILKSNGKYCFDLKSLSEYDELDLISEGYSVARIGEQWMFVTENDLPLKFKSPHFYFEIRPFKNGLAPVQREEGWFFINEHGDETTNCQYDDFTYTYNGLIRAYDTYMFEDKLYGYKEHLINSSGTKILTLEKGDAYTINDDCIIISHNRDYEVIDYEVIDYYGKRLFYTADYSCISNFYQYRAIALTKNTREVIIIDRSLNIIKKGVTLSKEIYFFDYKIVNGLLLLVKNEKYDFINLDGEIVWDFKYDFLSNFKDSFAIAGKLFQHEMKYTFLNHKLEEVIPFIYDEIDDFYEERARVRNGDKWGIIDTFGNVIIPIIFTSISNFQNGLVKVSIGDYKGEEYYGKYGFYNRDGEKTCPIIYDHASDFENDIAFVELKGKYGLLNKKGNQITPIKFSKIQHSSEAGIYYATENDKKFIIDDKGVEYTEEYTLKPRLPY